MRSPRAARRRTHENARLSLSRVAAFFPGHRQRKTRVATAAVGVLLLAGCGSVAEASGRPSPTTITVLAASSLTESFTTLAADFERTHPGVEVKLSFGSSSALATQVVEGAPADVFAAASPQTMATAVSQGAVTNPEVFASNSMAIAMPPGNPGQLAGLTSLADPGVKVAVCSPRVPCGAAALRVFENAHLAVTPVTQEPDVKAVTTKVRLGEVDAGIVYVTDIRAAGRTLAALEIPAADNTTTSYPIAVVRESTHKTQAQAFTAFVRGPVGQQVLAAAGFARP